MIPPANTHTSIVTGAADSVSFGLSLANEAHIMGMLREGLYSDKPLAILREYSSNAWDAHRDAGKHELPISVTLPTWGDHTLRIRDYGLGMSHETVFTVYNQYGNSTKRQSADVVGMLGIGSKSGFCYSDSFTVTSWHGGMKRVYVAALGEDEKGSLSLLAESPCEPTETGVEVQIATKPDDMREFERTARRLFQHMVPRPTINTTLPELPDERTVLTHGTLMPGSGEWIAVMGCVPYRINLGALDEALVNKCLPNLSGLLQFEIGEVAVSISREELKYTTATKAALITKFDALVDEFVAQTLAQLDATQVTWETRMRLQVLAQLALPLPDEWKAYGEAYAKVTYNPADFTIIHNRAHCTRLTVTRSTQLLIDDTGLDLACYHGLRDHHYVVRSPNGPADAAGLRAKLDAVLAAGGLTGVAIGLLSTLDYTAPYVKPKRITNPKHRAKMFELIARPIGKPPYSDNWIAVSRIPQPTDVFVLIDSFRPEVRSFWKDHEADAALAKGLGEVMPPVYGYKTTEKKPVLADACEGTEYSKWRQPWAQGLLTPERILLIDAYWRAHPEARSRYGYGETEDLPCATQLTWLTNQLGVGHPIVDLFTSAATAGTELNGRDHTVFRALADRNGLTYAKSSVAPIFAAIRKTYPLLARIGLAHLWSGGGATDSERDEWVEYVQLRDLRTAPVAKVVHLTSVP